MKKKNRKNNKAGIITVGGNFTLPGQKRPNVIVLTQPKRFGLDISDYMAAVRVAENVDFSRRYKLYDLYEDILMDTHLSCVLEKRKNAVLCSNMEFRVDGKPDDKINEQIQSPWFNRWWVTSLMRNSGASRSASSTSCRSGWIMTWYHASMWIRSGNSSCATRRTLPAIPGMNIPTCCLWVHRPIWGCWPRLHLGSSTNVTLRATGHSSPRYSACYPGIYL